MLLMPLPDIVHSLQTAAQPALSHSVHSALVHGGHVGGHVGAAVKQGPLQAYLSLMRNHIMPPIVEIPEPTALERAGSAYMAALSNHYFLTTMVQAFCLVALGDAGAQAIEGTASGSSYDAVRTLRMGLLGTFIGGVGTATWLKLLEGAMPGNGSVDLVVKKACLDACIWAPIANTLYLILTPLLEGESVHTVRDHLNQKFVPVMQTELATFLPYNLVSFSLVPPLCRPFTTGFISMCFAVYISWITHKTGSDPHGQMETEPPSSGEYVLLDE